MTDVRHTEVLRRDGWGYAVRVPGLTLRVIEGPDRGREATLADRPLVVGTHPDCGLALSDPAVSRHHFEIAPRPAGWLLRDLDSTNGTRVSGVRVGEAFVEPGLRVVVGATTVLLSPAEPREEPLAPVARFGRLIGASPVMRLLFDRLGRAAASDASVLLEGETGTGKDLAAEALHEASARAGGPFVVVDSGAVPRTLLESELFGHEKGAFTGATRSRPGAFELADGGTLFLDEIGELELDLQPRLLRALDRREVKRVGSNEVRRVDVRVVAATNRDLLRALGRGAFREDLYYRLAVVRIRMPPLREHPEDVPLLVRHMLSLLEPAGASYAVGDDVVARLAERDWPGNVRQLRNFVEHAVRMGEPELPVEGDGASGPPAAEARADEPFKEAKARRIERFEREYLGDLMARSAGNISQAARSAGLDRVHLLRLLDRYGLRPGREPGERGV